MARGDFTLFDEFVAQIGLKKHNLDTDVLKLAFIDNFITPTAGDATPQWGVGSGVDYDGNEVSTAGGYVAGGFTISAPSYVEAAGTGTLNDDDSNLSLAQNGSGFTNAYWAILYNDTATNKDAIGFYDLGGPVSEVAGPINFNFNASGILTIANA
jgi:hypothetical protein